METEKDRDILASPWVGCFPSWLASELLSPGLSSTHGLRVTAPYLLQVAGSIDAPLTQAPQPYKISDPRIMKGALRFSDDTPLSARCLAHPQVLTGTHTASVD